MEIVKWVLIMIASLSGIISFSGIGVIFINIGLQYKKEKDWAGLSTIPMAICCSLVLICACLYFFIIALLNAFGGNYEILGGF